MTNTRLKNTLSLVALAALSLAVMPLLAWAKYRTGRALESRALIADAALPEFFARVANPRIDGDVPFGGWAFRGPLALPCRWDHVAAR